MTTTVYEMVAGPARFEVNITSIICVVNVTQANERGMSINWYVSLNNAHIKPHITGYGTVVNNFNATNIIRDNV